MIMALLEVLLRIKGQWARIEPRLMSIENWEGLTFERVASKVYMQVLSSCFFLIEHLYEVGVWLGED